MQNYHYPMIECFCEECGENFGAYIAVDICPICAKLSKYTTPKFKINYEKIKTSPRWKDEQ